MRLRTNVARGCLAVAVFACFTSAAAQRLNEPVDYIDPNIGGIGQMLQPTWPTVNLPYGMMRMSPITTPGITDRYLADRIFGFPAGGLVLMPTSGPLETDPAQAASLYDHDLETATPYYYSVLLEKYNAEVEYTVSERAAYYRIRLPEGDAAHVLFSVTGQGEIKLLDRAALSGQEAGATGPAYFYVELSRPVSGSHAWRGPQAPRDRRQRANNGFGIAADFTPGKSERIGIRVGMSYISVEQARENLKREIPDWNFEAARLRARAAWNRALGKIAVKGGTEEQRTIFYTALYRTMERPADTVEYGKYYSPGDRRVHDAKGRGFYPSSGSLWGSYRSLHPLQLILDGPRQLDYVRTFIDLYNETGRMIGTGRSSMIGHHVAALMLDTYRKGYTDFDVTRAFEGLRKNAMEETFLPWRDTPQTSIDRVYIEKGFFPALAKGEKENIPEVDRFERRQAVSVTLETAYDDWATAEMAKIAARPEDNRYFLQRARNYVNVFDKRVGFMAPKTADGEWKYSEKEFDPIWSGGQGGRDYYTEMNAWTYTFSVQHDIAGLIDLLGGRENFVAKLDSLFTEQYRGLPPGGGAGNTKYHFTSWFPDMTGLIGQYAQGNEPSFHIPYLYNYAGAPWKTQRKVRQIMSVWYNAGPLGISGDEDHGEESSWYVFSAMGFYPVCPGRPVYDIGSPIFEETRIAVGEKVFTITAKNVSRVNKYVQAAWLNGKPLNRPWFEHRDLAGGGTLVLEMGPRPNTSWGSAPEAAPPSLSR